METTRFWVSLKIKYHTMLLGIGQITTKNHKAIKIVIMAVKKRLFHEDVVTQNAIKEIIESKILFKKYN